MLFPPGHCQRCPSGRRTAGKNQGSGQVFGPSSPSWDQKRLMVFILTHMCSQKMDESYSNSHLPFLELTGKRTCLLKPSAISFLLSLPKLPLDVGCAAALGWHGIDPVGCHADLGALHLSQFFVVLPFFSDGLKDPTLQVIRFIWGVFFRMWCNGSLFYMIKFIYLYI